MTTLCNETSLVAPASGELQIERDSVCGSASDVKDEVEYLHMHMNEFADVSADNVNTAGEPKVMLGETGDQCVNKFTHEKNLIVQIDKVALGSNARVSMSERGVGSNAVKGATKPGNEIQVTAVGNVCDGITGASNMCNATYKGVQGLGFRGQSKVC